MTVWLDIEARIAKMPSTLPARMKFLDRVNFYGAIAELDDQGRVLIQPRLRDSAQMAGEVDVLGQQNFLEVWNHERFVAKLVRDPFTNDDAKSLADSVFRRLGDSSQEIREIREIFFGEKG